MLEIKVQGKSIVTINTAVLVKGTVGEKMAISCDEEWGNRLKTVVFKRFGGCGKPYVVYIGAVAETEIEIPPEILHESGQFRIGLYSVMGSDVTPTLWSDTFNVEYGSDTTGIAPKPPTADVYSQIIQQLDDIYDVSATAIRTAQSVREDADNGAFNGKDGKDGEKGDKGDKGDDYILTEKDKQEIANLINGVSYYYDNLETAIYDINNNDIGRNAKTDEETAVVNVTVKKDKKIVKLLKDIELQNNTQNSRNIEVDKTITLNLNGYTLTLGSGVCLQSHTESIVFTILGNGGKIVKNVADTTLNERIFFAYNGTLEVIGGEYSVIVNNCNANTGACWCRDSAKLILNGCKIYNKQYSTTESSKGCYVCYGAKNSEIDVIDCILNSETDNYLSYGCLTQGKINIINCNFNISAYGPDKIGEVQYCAAYGVLTTGVSSNAIIENSNIVAETPAKEVTVRAFYNEGTAKCINSKFSTDAHSNQSIGVDNINIIELFDCYAYGTHSGLQYRGSACYVNGGLYEGCAHGGIYHGADGTATAQNNMYVENATIVGADYNGKYKSDYGWFGGVSRVVNSSLYVSSGNYMSLYLDNCVIKGGWRWAMVLSWENTHIYLSNCTIDRTVENHIISSEANDDFTGIKALSEEEITQIKAEQSYRKPNYLSPKPLIRVDSANSKLHFGAGNNFINEDILVYRSTVTESPDYDNQSDVIEQTNIQFYIK